MNAKTLIAVLGGRKLVGLILALVALAYGPKEAYATVAMIYGMFVGGNGWEHFTNGKEGEAALVQPTSEAPATPPKTDPPAS